MSAPPFKVKAVYEYKSPHDDDLSFPNGQIITVTEEEDAEWYVGEYVDKDGQKQDGLFPRNFVERYEPEAPPRPTRARPKKEAAAPAETEPEIQEATTAPAASAPEEPSAIVADPVPPVATAKAEPTPAPKPQAAKPVGGAKGPPPAVSEKPSSFRDRIAAFNKPAAPPVAPKPSGPSGGGGAGFIKKPFVAPPPARDAYVPPPRADPAPQKIYRREEDPEIQERQAQDREDAEKAGLGVGENTETSEDAPKATSLKDRIALLQKQQQEQAMRRADASSKEKPKKPPKARSEQQAPPAADIEDDDSDLSRIVPADAAIPPTGETSREMPKVPPGRRPSRDAHAQGQPLREVVSDGNEADQSGAGETTEEADGDSTEVDEHDATSKPPTTAVPTRSSTIRSREVPSNQSGQEAEQGERGHGGEEEEDEEEEEEDIDPEVRRKMELRERMAKMSGGMGMGAMFGPPGGMQMPGSAAKKTSGSNKERTASQGSGSSLPPQRAPMVPIPGMQRVQSPLTEDDKQLGVEKESEPSKPTAISRPANEVPDVENAGLQAQGAPRVPERGVPPPVPQDRPLPPAPQAQRRSMPPPVPGDRPVSKQPDEARQVPPPPPRAPVAEPEEYESGDETPLEHDTAKTPLGGPPPIPSRDVQQATANAPSKRASQLPSSSPPLPPTSPPSSNTDKRASRPPPVPGTVPQMPPPTALESRPPPPPPPTAAPTRRSTELPATTTDSGDDGESDYEGDYDTDIASGAPHKAALKAHGREPSLDEGTLSDDLPPRPSANAPQAGPPPVPTMQRAAPPPPPHAPLSRQSMDAPRGAPPMPPRGTQPGGMDDDYDPYNYAGPPPLSRSSTRVADSTVQASDPSLYDATPKDERGPPLSPPQPPRQVHAVPPPLPPDHTSPPLASMDQRDRQSREVPRASGEPSRPSMTQQRLSMDPSGRAFSETSGPIARDVDLAESSHWWVQPNTPPPVFQNRPDVLCEFEESTTSKRGGRSTISKDVYVLFQDYSQTVVTARYDAKEPTTNVHLEQRHELAPPKMRQDQLEHAYSHFGEPIAAAAGAKAGSTLGDGSPQAFVVELLRGAAPTALQPVGTRTYGALVYGNMANASVQQNDSIRPGDIVSFRNARFQGKHGAMHAKYALDVGKPEHVAIVAEWDGTKKKIRAWEQGREKDKKVRMESFKVGDLRSGEVKVWRVVGRDWVGWEGES